MSVISSICLSPCIIQFTGLQSEIKSIESCFSFATRDCQILVENCLNCVIYGSK